MPEIRPMRSDDIVPLAGVLDATGLFPGSMLPDMTRAFLAGAAEDEIWLTYEADGVAAGFCYAARERMTDGSWNMLAIAVRPEAQGRGIGSTLVGQVEREIGLRAGRIIIVDTSGLPEFQPARQFYGLNGYVEEARIREFWGEGNDKVVFWKRIA